MYTEQDTDILISLINTKEAVSSYQISKDTGISVPQVRYRLNKLILSGIIKRTEHENRDLYEPHPALKSKKTIKEISNHIKEIADIIDSLEISEPDCIKSLLLFIIERTSIEYLTEENHTNESK